MGDWLTWQIVDSAFPTGLFAHSGGLEAAWQHGEIEDAGALRRFLDASILQCGCSMLPLVNAVHTAPERLPAIDRVAEAFLLNPVANRASRVQGRTLLATAGRVWPSAALTTLTGRAEGTMAHVGPLWGATFRALGIDLQSAQRMALFGAARGVLSAAVRLGIAGSYEAQRMQAACAPQLEQVARRCEAMTVDDLAQTAPLIDLLQAGHDRLYSRLFQS